jgi:hypothetical protein
VASAHEDPPGSGNKFLNVLGNANSILAGLTINGGDGTDTVTVDDTADGDANTGLLSSTQIMGIFGTGGVVTYSGLESLTINLGNAVNSGNTFSVLSTHGTSTSPATTLVRTGAGDDSVFVQEIDGTTTIDTGAGNDTFAVGSTVAPAFDPISTSTLNKILNATLTLTAGTGSNVLHAYDSGDTGPNNGVLTSTTLERLGMTLGIAYTGIQTIDIQLSKGDDHFTVVSTPVNSTLTTSSVSTTTSTTSRPSRTASPGC